LTAEKCPRPIAKGDHLYLVDGSGYIFRAYHALPPLVRKSDGLPTGAVAGFSNMLWKLLQDMKSDQPTHLAVVFDASESTFRNEIYPEYKANRDDPPDDLMPQFPLTREATRAFGVACVEQHGYEADDLIATYARLAREAGARVTIVSSDKDLMQLVIDGQVEMLDTMKNKRIATAEVMERFGVPPSKVVEVQALAGDSTDNVPGVPGIGVKTAAELIGTYGDLETLLLRAPEIKQPKRRQSLIDHAENARISKRLVQLDLNVPLETQADEFAVCDPDPKQLVPFLKNLEFGALLKRAAAKLGIEDLDLLEGMPAPAPKPPSEIHTPPPMTDAACPGVVLDRALFLRPIDYGLYTTITDIKTLEKWVAEARNIGAAAISVEASSHDPMQATLCGIAIATEPGRAAYVPLGHRASAGLALDAGVKQLSEKDALPAIKALVEDDATMKVGHNLKFAYTMLARVGLAMRPMDDVMLMSYVLDTGLHGHSLDELSEIHLSHKPVTLAGITGKGRDRITFEQAAVADATRYAAENADIALRLAALLKPRLVAERRMAVYETLERPLIPILSDMERAGIEINPPFLIKLSNDFAQAMAKMEKEIHKLAGENFNLGSPKQLGDILFGKLSLPGGKKTQTGAWSTHSDILDELAAQGHELPARILEWRQIAKLKSTYTDALPAYVNPQTRRVHTYYSLASTTTGRLSSTEPNLQNIPIRTEEGRRIRQAFIAPKGKCLVSADYSQIELRLLCHVADVPALSRAFSDGIDIHATTASEMFGVPVKGMPAEVRRRAKAINFGIIYGISAFGLANQLGIPRGEADQYIRKYFERFPGIRDYMDRTKKFVRDNGYVDTIFGRRIHIQDVKSQSAAQRAFGERQAINAPLQGSAADIIRRAMVRLPAALAEKHVEAKLLLQVHDELVIEAPTKEAEAVCEVARGVMERAALPAIELRVPLVVDARSGANWDEAH
jgi:DNA polymerase I